MWIEPPLGAAIVDGEPISDVNGDPILTPAFTFGPPAKAAIIAAVRRYAPIVFAGASDNDPAESDL